MYVLGPFGCGVVFQGVWEDGEDWVQTFVCFWNFLGMVVAYDYGCDGGVFFGDHSCLVGSFCGGFMVRWVGHFNTHSFRGFC